MNPGHRYFILNKPYGMVSQFISPHAVPLLRDLNFPFPEGIHAIGRLDGDSEGLLLLTTNKKITRLLFQGAVPHKRTYLVKVKYTVSIETLGQLRAGVPIPVAGGFYTTAPAEAAIVEEPAGLFHHPAETPDYRPFTWLTITLTEGKFHQVRKMVGTLGHRCIRLIRLSIEDLELGDLPVGAVLEIEEAECLSKLRIG